MPRKTVEAALPVPLTPPASMRPRPDATENMSRWSGGYYITFSFNEAAARCHGKQALVSDLLTAAGCFNEAAARCHGKRGDQNERRSGIQRFNEAAARCHGKRGDARQPCTGRRGASMRPRPDATENVCPILHDAAPDVLQ